MERRPWPDFADLRAKHAMRSAYAERPLNRPSYEAGKAFDKDVDRDPTGILFRF